MSEKTEQPTPKRLRDARKKGQVAKSREVTSTAVIVGLFGYIICGGSIILHTFKELILLPSQYYRVEFNEGLKNLFNGVIYKLIFLLFPIAILAMVTAIAASFFQIGFLFVFEPIKPDLKKLNPAQSIKKIFSKDNLIELIKSIVKVSFLGFLIYVLIKNSINALLHIPYLGLESVFLILEDIFKKLIYISSSVFIVISAFDYYWQKKQHIKKLMMTKDEVKREYKEMEGDPQIKSKRRQLHREMIMNSTIERTRKATVLITNPTRRAVALYYEKSKSKLPVVLAKGENLIAKKMIEVAKEEGIPIMQNIPLAHALYEHVEIDKYIPSDLIEPVVEVLKWVEQLKNND
ncbi:type III secretion system export apparatus subunit SctU [Desulfothermus sp.]